MNIFEQYLEKIIKIIDELNHDSIIKLSENDGSLDQLPNII